LREVSAVSKTASVDDAEGEDEGDQLWISTKKSHSGTRSLHTDTECPGIKDYQDLQATTRDEHLEASLCSRCGGEYEPHDGGAVGPYTLLRDPDVTDLDDVREALGGDGV
jgi:hypothetical protein